MMKKAFQKIQAFTLIELIVVIAIIAILATSGTLMLTKRFSSARDSSRKQAVSQISTALDVSMTSRTSFPSPESSTEVYDVSGALVWYQGVFGPSVADIITAIDAAPQDPSTNEYYGYSISSDKKKYQLKAELENEDTIAYLNQAYAADDENKIAYVDGNYNGYILTYTGGKYYLYKLPSIFMKNTGLQAGSKVGSGTLPLVNPGKKISNDVQVKVADITAVVEDTDSDGSVANAVAAKLGIEVNLISKVVKSAAGSELATNSSGGGGDVGPVQADPSGLALSHSTRSKTFTFSWTGGAENGGSCKLQYLKDTTTRTDIDANTYDCDADITDQSVTLPGDGWSGAWSSVEVRVVRSSDEEQVGVFTEKLVCSSTSGSSTSTPTIDEDCDGTRDEPGTDRRFCSESRSTCSTSSQVRITGSCGNSIIVGFGTVYCNPHNIGDPCSGDNDRCEKRINVYN